ncbi:hypothetical protein RND81_02G161400 [Saponaria officinalis]|uniref:Myb/SANT-like domain-containing protein n=1 Tax=Saponaria officinalis TaxID=3572 RepID=A0AAW1MTR2_SAPOF
MARRIQWTDGVSRKLLVILNEEKSRGVSKFIWTNIAKNFSAQTGYDVNAKQVKNHYTDLKEKYKSWEELQSLTGISYNPITKEVDVEERSLERYEAFKERNAKYGVKIIKQTLANLDELNQLFDGKAAHGVGGFFSPAMAKGPSYLTKPIQEIDEGSGDNDDDDDDVDCGNDVSAEESRSPPRSTAKKVSATSSRKRKSEDTVDSIELKRRQTSFDSVIQLLSGAGIGSSSGPSKAEKVNAELTRMGVPFEKGDEYFVSALRYLCDEKHADIFLSLQYDNQKWIYMKGMDADPVFQGI